MLPVRMITALAVALTLAACGDEDRPAQAPTVELPGAELFPEGIAVDPADGAFYVGSTTDGTILRGTAGGGAASVFLEGGRDGRSAATGLAVDDRRRLWVAGRFSRTVDVYDLETRRRLARLRAPGGVQSFTPRDEQALINDVTVTPDAAYVTDSFRPVLYRADRRGERIGGLRPWLDLSDGPIEYAPGFNLNGITSTADGSVLVTVHTDTGELFRIDTRSGQITRIDLGGATVVTGDGLELSGRTLYVVRENPAAVVEIELSRDLRTGRVARELTDPGLRFPTTAALGDDGALLVVNSQLDLGPGAAPELPFDVSVLGRG